MRNDESRCSKMRVRVNIVWFCLDFKEKTHHVLHFNFLHHHQNTNKDHQAKLFTIHSSLWTIEFNSWTKVSSSIFEQFKTFGADKHTHTSSQYQYFHMRDAINGEVTKVTSCKTIDTHRYIYMQNQWLVHRECDHSGRWIAEEEEGEEGKNDNQKKKNKHKISNLYRFKSKWLKFFP